MNSVQEVIYRAHALCVLCPGPRGAQWAFEPCASGGESRRVLGVGFDAMMELPLLPKAVPHLTAPLSVGLLESRAMGGRKWTSSDVLLPSQFQEICVAQLAGNWNRRVPGVSSGSCFPKEVSPQHSVHVFWRCPDIVQGTFSFLYADLRSVGKFVRNVHKR